MKPFALFILVAGMSQVCFGQSLDSAAYRQAIDSLIALNRNQVAGFQFEPALKTIAEAERLSNDLEGSGSALFARCLYFHGRTFFYAGQYREALKYYRQAIEIQAVQPGKGHADYAFTLTGIGNACNELGLYEEAEPYYLEAKDIRATVFGANSTAYANALNNLAVLYTKLGAYEKAEPIWLESKALRAQLLGQDHPDYTAALQNLAILYYHLGQYQKAEDNYRECIDIREKTLGVEHPDYASALEGLAFLYYALGQFEKAEPLLLHCKSIRATALGRGHPDYAAALNNLAYLYCRLQKYSQAKQLFNECIALRDSVNLGQKDQFDGNVLTNIGLAYQLEGDYQTAADYYEKSTRIWKTFYHSQHPLVSMGIQNLAEAKEMLGQYLQAEVLLLDDNLAQQNRLSQSAGFLSEKELAAYSALFEEDLHRALNFIHRRINAGQPPGRLPQLCYDKNLFYKGFLLSVAQQIRQASLSNADTKIQVRALQGLQRRLAIAYSQPQPDTAAITALEAEANTLEKYLAEHIGVSQQQGKGTNWKAIAQQLQAGEMAIEFVRFPVFFPHPTDSVLYGAILLSAGDTLPYYIPIAEEKALQKALEAYTGAHLRDLRGIQPVKTAQFKDLYTLVMGPLRPFIEHKKRVYYAPAGLLHRVSFEALLAQQAGDWPVLHLTGSTRLLAHQQGAERPTWNRVTLWGAVDFNAANPSPDAPANAPVATRSGDPEAGEWKELPGTMVEITALQTLFNQEKINVLPYTGAAATEAAFKELGAGTNSPPLIHIATHGFFFPDPQKRMAPGRPEPGGFAPVFQTSDQPMLRSGLVLAGANYAWKNGNTPEGNREDGILTAYEISQMDLSGTELVVLSACETGLGDIQGNEGVYGLQRAFKMAGVRYLMMSLWKVPDAETARLMHLFYQNQLTLQMDIRTALKAAQTTLQKEGLDSYYWAGFILLE